MEGLEPGCDDGVHSLGAELMRAASWGSTAIDEARGAFVTEASEPLVGGLAGYPHGFGGIGWLPAVDQHPVDE